MIQQSKINKIGSILSIAILYLAGHIIIPSASFAEESVCAQVKIEIAQELTLERQAFDAHMRIHNGLETLPLDNVAININFSDENGNSVLATSDPNNTTASFFITLDSLTGITDISGFGQVAPTTTADVHWLIIPAQGSGGQLSSGKLYFVGAALSYVVGGKAESVEVTPDFITVKPMPELTLDYFLTHDVYADDAFTPAIEAPEPFTLGVRIRNSGSGVASNISIDSAQPRIIENEQGLLIGFQIIGSNINDAPASPSLAIGFGNIEPGHSTVGRWIMQTTLSGKFIEFDARFTHADELGGELTSLIDAVSSHLLVHDVRVDLPGRDNVRDFLALDGNVLRVYESDSVDTVVTDQSGFSDMQLGSIVLGDYIYSLTNPPTAGFMYVKLADPHDGNKVIKSVVRSDGKVIPLDNAWLSKERQQDTSWNYYINFFDTNSKSSYQVIMGDPVFGPRPPVLQAVPSRSTAEGHQVSFIIQASDPDGTTPSLTATPLPVGANFIDQGNGTGIFDWTPVTGQTGQYTISFKASDGLLSDTKLSTITVNPGGDSDGDGMDDAWEILHFGDLSRDGLGDYDGDGISDYQEFLDGTDPTVGVGPGDPVIQSPLYGDEVTSLQPQLTIVNSAHPAGKTLTYEFEVYLDEAMTILVADATGVAEGTLTTIWEVTPALQDNTWYTWRVRAFDGYLYSLWVNGRFFVNTINDVPEAFSINSPQDGMDVGTTNPVLEVINSVDVDGDTVLYSFEVFGSSSLSHLVASVSGINEGANGVTNWMVDTPLLENTYYYWRATATDEHGAQTVSPVASFFVNTANDAPGLPAISSPTDGSSVTTYALDLVVNTASDPDSSTLYYYFELDRVTSYDSPDKQVSGPVLQGASTTQWPVSGLLEDVTYYWRVLASDGAANSSWVQASFRVNAVNLPPPAPTINNPGEGAWVATLTPTLSINPSVDPDGDEVSYHFELYSDVTLSTLEAQYSASALDWMLVDPLTDNIWYYWRARAEDSHGSLGEWSSVSSFFVDDNGIDDVPVFAFTEPATNVTVNNTGSVDIRWNDSDPDSNATIALYYDTNNSGSDGVLIVGDLAEDLDGDGDLYAWNVANIPNGTYWIYAVISDATSSVTVYSPVSVTIGVISQFINASGRAYVGTGANLTHLGLIISGSNPKNVLIKTMAPSLSGAPFNIPGTLANPYVRIYSFTAGTYIAQQDNWQQTPSCAGYVCSGPPPGKDPCQPNPGQTSAPPGCANEAAFQITLPPGAYTAIMNGVNNGVGVGLVSANDLDDPSSASSHIINLSTRAYVGTGANLTHGGFIISGTTPKKMLIKARGPFMSGAPFFVPGTLANPYVRIYSFTAGTYIAQQDNWQQTPSCPGYVCSGPPPGKDPCQPNPGQTSAPPGCANEAAFQITLPPGAYTMIMNGVNNGVGVGLVSADEITDP